jgi:predicted nuclease of restriction endonuclease-like (RecB) superfamily
MKAKESAVKGPSARPRAYGGMLSEVVRLVEQARRFSARAVNATMTATYWIIGRHIVEYEQQGRGRAEYGERLLKRMAGDLTRRCGRGFSLTNIKQFRQFYLAYPGALKSQTVSGQLMAASKEKGQTASDLSAVQPDSIAFPLPWSAYVSLLSVKDGRARAFYTEEALRGGWSVRQLDRQIDAMFYERTALSRNKAAMLEKGGLRKQTDAVFPEEEIKNPYVLEFLGLRDEYSESDIEEALIQHLERFLLELGRDFAFVGRQRRLRIGDEWYRMDLLFFHRRLRCLVVIDLKIGKFTHADAGQMHMYLNYAREHWVLPGENPPVGLILCARKDEAVARYALENLPNKVLAAEYRTVLPDEQIIAGELEKTRRLLEERGDIFKRRER